MLLICLRPPRLPLVVYHRKSADVFAIHMVIKGHGPDLHVNGGAIGTIVCELERRGSVHDLYLSKIEALNCHRTCPPFNSRIIVYPR